MAESKGFEQDALEKLFANVVSKKSFMHDKFVMAGKGEAFVLRYVLHHGVSTPSQLATAMRSSTGRISAVLGALQKKGFVSREIDDQDRRNIHVSLTAAGRRQAEREEREMHSHVCWAFSQMGERRTRAFVDLVAEFMTYMSMYQPGGQQPSAEQVAEAFEKQRNHQDAG